MGTRQATASVAAGDAAARGGGTTEIQVSPEIKNHPLLRRWDHKAGNPQDGGLTLMEDNAARILEGEGTQNWLKLEDGIIIQFQHGEDMTDPPIYHTGDYWLIPARTAIDDIEWRTDHDGHPQPQPPRGIRHHYASLGIVTLDKIESCRCEIIPRCPQEVRVEFTVTPKKFNVKPQNEVVQTGFVGKTNVQDTLEKAAKAAKEKKAAKGKKENKPK